jgi:hypothetical protein
MRVETFPALYARLEPSNSNTYTVTCTATLQPLGRVWWICEKGTDVWWHFATAADDARGIVSTQRNAVARLRELANGKRQRPLPMGEDAPAPAPIRRATPRPAARPEPVDPPPAPIVWPSGPSVDLTQAVGDALRRRR